eukprot:g3320.t1
MSEQGDAKQSSGEEPAAAPREEEPGAGGQRSRESSQDEGEEEEESTRRSDADAEAKGSGGGGSGDAEESIDGDAASSADDGKEKSTDVEDPKGTPRGDTAVTKDDDGDRSDDDGQVGDGNGGATKSERGEKEEGSERDSTARKSDDISEGRKGSRGGGESGDDGDKVEDGDAVSCAQEEKKEAGDGEHQATKPGDEAAAKSTDSEGSGGGDATAGGGLAIDIVAANGDKGVVGGDGGRPPSDAGSRESTFFEEEPDELEVDLDKPWEKPSKEHAKKMGKRMIWNNGMRHYFKTSIKEIGSMGVGMYLYFWMIRIVAIMFAFCTIFSIPAMFLNQQGNDGMAIPENDIDSLGLVTLSYGNQGLNPDLVVESGCRSSNGTVDCTGETVQVMGEARDTLWVGYILVGGEVVISFFFLLFIVVLSERLKAKIDEIDDANVTPGDYSVMVRGLPADVTKEEVSPSVVEYAELGTGASAFGMGLVTVLLCMIVVFGAVEGCSIGAPRKRDTPLQEWEKGRKQRERDKKKSAQKYSAAPGKVLPVETNPVANVGTEGAIAKEFDSSAAVTQADGDAGVVAKLEEGGIVAGGAGGVEPLPPQETPGVPPPIEAKPDMEEPHPSFADGRPPDPLPCQSCLNTHDKSFVGGWVSDVVLGNPVGDVLMGFMDQEANIEKIAKARTVVRQMKTLGKAKKLAKAEAKLAKLKAKEEALMAATRKKQDPAALDSISVAFVTFEHEESKKRCLEDYRYSRRGFCRRFQPSKLQFSRMPAEGQQDENGQASSGRRGKKKKPRMQKWRLKVFQAPEPSDVKWENLDVTPTSRKLRRAFTSLVCVVLLILSFIIIYLAQTEQAKLQAQIPALDTCEEAIPAVVFGTYDFPLDSELQRNEDMDSTCVEGSFYIAFTNGSHPSNEQLDYDNLPPLFSADGTSVPRDEGTYLCDDPCQPTSGGGTCRALSCFERSWEGQGYDCVSYPQSTMVGCFCLDAVVSSLQERGFWNGAKMVAREQGAVCAPFLRDYAKANAIKTLAVLSVVIVNTLLTGVMAKLAKFERHVSLSDYTSTVTAKLALAQFLNTALIVIIVNAAYTGGGLGLLQDFGILAGDYKDFERSWYATVGVAVAMTMLINVVVPHATTLVGEIVVKPIKRFFKQRSVATQSEMNNLYKPPKFDMESRYAFLLQVLGVSLLYSGGIPVLYLFACFNFATNFIVDKLWIMKLAQQPPMYTASLAKMFVGVLPLALLMHIDEARAIAQALDGQGMTGLVADHVLRKHVFALFVLTTLFVTVYVVYKIVGDPLLQLVKLVLRVAFNILFGWMCKKKTKKITEEQQQTPGKVPSRYTAEFFRLLKKGEKIEADEKKMGWVECEENGNRIAKWICTEDGPGPRGVRYKSGVPRQTWQVIAELGQYNYAMEESDHAGMATRYMATAGFLSPRMKEKEQAKLKKAEKLVTAEEGASGGAHFPEAPAPGGEAEPHAASAAKDAPASSSQEKQQDGPAATADEKEETPADDAAEKKHDGPAAPDGEGEEKPSAAASSGEAKPPPDADGKTEEGSPRAPAGGEAANTENSSSGDGEAKSSSGAEGDDANSHDADVKVEGENSDDVKPDTDDEKSRGSAAEDSCKDASDGDKAKEDVDNETPKDLVRDESAPKSGDNRESPRTGTE